MLIDIAIKDADLTGYISKNTLREFFNLFSWVYLEGNVKGAFDPGTKLEVFISRFDLFRFKGSSLCYSAVLFYQKLSRVIDLREFENDIIITAKTGTNKMFFSEDFSYKKLYDMYCENKGDLSPDFLLFNELFKVSSEKEVRKIKSYAEITKSVGVSSLVRPDLSYKLASKQLDVNNNLDFISKDKNKIYILQDSTYSMQQYEGQLRTLKAFILNCAFENQYEVEWLFISDRINHRVTYNRENIESSEIRFVFFGVTVNTSSILIQDEFVGKKVVIITDGTDMFNFPFNTKTKDINVISFLDNINIKDKISTYGRFFKIST